MLWGMSGSRFNFKNQFLDKLILSYIK